MELADIAALAERQRSQVEQVVVGQRKALELMLVALLSRGHVLLEGLPGTAKTLLAHVLARGLGLGFQRIQFTPDLMPGDVLGTTVFDFDSRQFALTRGPIFTELLLADEINRTPPKTQSALLQAMQERVVTIDGSTHELGDLFTVVATQNPLELEGTYPLPEAQLDRFLVKVRVDYPSEAQERAMVGLHGEGGGSWDLERFDLEVLLSPDELRAARQVVSRIEVSDAVRDYLVGLVRATREHPSLAAGASPRATNMLATAARSRAALDGRAFVLPDDVKALAGPVLGHRLVLAPGADLDGLSAEAVLTELLQQVPAPR